MTAMLRVLVSAAAIGSVACATTTQTRSGSSTTVPSGPVVSESGPVVVNESRPGVVPAGQELDVRLQSSLRLPETATVEQRFEAATVVDLRQGGRVLIPAVSIVRGVVSGVEKAGRLDSHREAGIVLRSNYGERTQPRHPRHRHRGVQKQQKLPGSSHGRHRRGRWRDYRRHSGRCEGSGARCRYRSRRGDRRD